MTSVEDAQGRTQPRVFYQSKKRETRYATFDAATSQWTDAAVEDQNGGKVIALGGSSLAVSVDGDTTRLFYLSRPQTVKMLKRTGDSGPWTSSELTRTRPSSPGIQPD